MTDPVFQEDAYARDCAARVVAAGPDGIRLDRTVFYPMGGGQPGDTGLLRLADGTEIVVSDTRKGADGDILHMVAEGTPLPAPGTEATAEIDWPRRHRLMRMHSCLHLLCAAVPGAVTGGSVGDGKGRLDFNLPDTKPEKEPLTAALNQLVEEDHEVRPRWITDQELAANPNLVRTMSVKPPMGTGSVRVLDIAGVDLQPCGGTHVRRTGDIGFFKITGESALAAGVRRIEAVAGAAAVDFVRRQEDVLGQAAASLKAAPADLAARVEGLLDDRRRLERELTELRHKMATGGGGEGPEAHEVGGVAFASRVLADVPPRDLKPMADALKTRVGSGVVALVSVTEGKASLVVGVTDDLTGRVSAVDLVRAGSAAVGGKGGGGRPDMAQAGGPDGAAAEAALSAIEQQLAGI